MGAATGCTLAQATDGSPGESCGWGGGGDTGYWGRDGSRGHSWGLMGDLEAWDAKW